jgi:hypothetical protein
MNRMIPKSCVLFARTPLPVSMWCIGTYLIALSTVAFLQTQSDEETSSAQLFFCCSCGSLQRRRLV